MNYDEVTSVSVEMTIKFDGVEYPDIAAALLKNGRFVGFLVEPLGGLLSGDQFTHVDAKGFDFKSLDADQKNRESKLLTAGGAKLGPSSFYGAGRKADPQKFVEEIAPSKDYIITDQTKLAEHGTVDVVLKRGEDIAAIGHSVSYKNRHLIFGDRECGS
jgi:hypothetical protein